MHFTIHLPPQFSDNFDSYACWYCGIPFISAQVPLILNYSTFIACSLPRPLPSPHYIEYIAKLLGCECSAPIYFYIDDIAIIVAGDADWILILHYPPSSIHANGIESGNY